MNELAQKIYSAFSPVPLKADEDPDLYVSLDDVRGSGDIVHRLGETIRLAQGAPTCQVLAGHRGSGKSTELYRLRRELERGSPRFFVVFCTADEDIDRNDVDFPDVLIAIIRQMAAQLKERADIELKPGYFRDRWDRLKKVLGDLEIDSLGLEAGMAKIAVAIKSSPDARLEIRKLLEPDTGNWLTAANDVIGKAVLELSKTGYDGLVILVDDLDKMVVRPHHEAGCTTDEYLFVHRSGQLTDFSCHVIYTLPLSLAYSHHEQTIKSSFGGHVPVVPMTKIATKPPESRRYSRGYTKFQQIIEKRLQSVGAVSDDLCSARVRNELIKLSGGQPTELMTLVREAIIAHGLPIDGNSLRRARREGQREYARQLRNDHWPIIEDVRSDGTYTRTRQSESAFRELLDSRAILQYVNDEEWYGLNPMVAALQPPTASSSDE